MSRGAGKSLPVLLSTIKIRRAGFHACRDSQDGLLYWHARLAVRFAENLRSVPVRAAAVCYRTQYIMNITRCIIVRRKGTLCARM